MHASSLENMQLCCNKYLSEGGDTQKRRVLDVGGADVNGSYAQLFDRELFEYIGADIQAVEGVSLVLEDPLKLPLEDASIDVVISGQMLEHCAFFWQVFAEMIRVLKPDGHLFLIAPSAGPIHNHPVDCYRFYPDAYRALADYASCHLLEVWHDDRGPWNDLVGVFNKTGTQPNSHHQAGGTALERKQALSTRPHPASQWEHVRGSEHYLQTLARIHNAWQPSSYLEIGIRHGRSLALAECPAVGVDPSPELASEIPDSTTIITKASDQFFAEDVGLLQQPELVFIDGMHLFEYALRDFMNAELHAGGNTLVVIDDIYPSQPEQAKRDRCSQVWTGDVWKLHHCLKIWRPDLTLLALDTEPTGLLLIAGLDPANRTLRDNYNPIVREMLAMSETPPPEYLERQDCIDPIGAAFARVLTALRSIRQQGFELADRVVELGAALNFVPPPLIEHLPPAPTVYSGQAAQKLGSNPLHKMLGFLRNIQRRKRTRNIKLSVVVVAYNMARELPRTLLSLSPAMQREIEAANYEIIVVDNGSSAPFDRDLCQSLCPNARFYDCPVKSHSPVAAINLGLEQARGELVGVMIDGARMASPGLLASVIGAAKIRNRIVIGTIACHLGNKVQPESVKEGYNQAAEDALLESSQWQQDGYRLFDISVLAGSSAQGWYAIPQESNAIFLRREHWRELGGYEERFQAPGGGLVNLDTWKRACELPKVTVAMILGESTFHQFHGGVATNSQKSPWQQFAEEYEAIRGEAYRPPNAMVTYFGRHYSDMKARMAC